MVLTVGERLWETVLSLRVIDEANVTSLGAFLTLQATSHDKVLYSVELLSKTRKTECSEHKQYASLGCWCWQIMCRKRQKTRERRREWTTVGVHLTTFNYRTLFCHSSRWVKFPENPRKIDNVPFFSPRKATLRRFEDVWRVRCQSLGKPFDYVFIYWLRFGESRFSLKLKSWRWCRSCLRIQKFFSLKVRFTVELLSLFDSTEQEAVKKESFDTLTKLGDSLMKRTSKCAAWPSNVSCEKRLVQSFFHLSSWLYFLLSLTTRIQRTWDWRTRFGLIANYIFTESITRRRRSKPKWNVLTDA